MNGTPGRIDFRWLAIVGLVLVFSGLTGGALLAQNGTARAVATTLAEADRLYADKSYAGALEAYERLLKAGSVPENRRDEVAYRIAESLGKAERWDRALEYGLEFVKSRRGTVWEPRGLYWLGRLYLGVPHQGWRAVEKVDDGKKLYRVYRGQDVPKVESESKPEQVQLWEQDTRNARDAFEAARVLYPRFRAERRTEAEEIQLNFDLARWLQQTGEQQRWASRQNWAPPADPQWKVDPSQPYDPEWPAPKRILYLFEQIRALASGAGEQRVPPSIGGSGGPLGPGGLQRHAAPALFSKALWLRSYQQMMQRYAQRYVQDEKGGRTEKIPFPYQDEQPVELLRQLVREHPEHPIRDQVQYTIGTFLLQEGKWTDAETEFRRFMEERPQSKWVEDARHQLHEMNRKVVGLHPLGPQAPGQNAKVSVSYRNVKELHFELFRVKLEDVVARPDRLNNPEVQLNNFAQNFGSLKEAERFYGPVVARWDWTTKDNGDRQHRSEAISLPVKEPGAYVLEVSAPQVHAAGVVLVSDLAVVQKVHKDAALFFATNMQTGSPAGEVEIVAKQYWYEGGRQHSAATRGRTTADGLVSIPLQRAPGRQSFRVSALAYRGNRYGMTDPMWTNDHGDNSGTFKAYSITDRSVYRPGQTVFYRQMLVRREGSEWKPLAGKHIKVDVRDPKGAVIHTKSETSNEFGSISGELTVPSEAPLGEYYVHCYLPDESRGPTQLGGNRFRVEEYKKPEFEVTVDAGADRVKLGQPVTAKVKASYYFGGPVPNAKVSYRVYRNYWAQRYQFPRPFDFLYRYWGEGDYNLYYRNGEVVSQGEVKTDANGEAVVKVETKADSTRWRNADLSYTVEADVQDSSRRTISGTGSVKATRHDVAAFLNYPRGYANKEDRVEVEVMTLNPSDQPVSVSGTGKVYLQPRVRNAEPQLVFEQPLKTDRHGRGYLKWTPKEGGYYSVVFETKDTEGQLVKGATNLWVEGPELARGEFLFRNLTMEVQEPYYEEGQTAKVLIVAPEPDCTVLLTREGNNEVYSKQVIELKGRRSIEVQIPLTRKDVPNVYLQAIMVRGGQMFQATRELFVPPARQFTTVSVTADKQQYEPGQKARFRLQAKDWRGRPVRTELSVAVTDASLGYIQKDYAPDIRAYFYGDRRSQSVQQNNSIQNYLNPHAEDNQPREQFKTHEWVMPEGMGQLEDWPGKLLQQYGFGFNHYYRYGGQVRFRGAMGGGFGGGPAELAPGAAGPAGPRGPVGQSAFALDALAESSVARMPRISGAVNLGLKAKADRDNAGGDLAEATLRTRFSDTAFWTPAVRTDAQGNATVEVTWPDNLTQWRALAVGATQTAQVGSGETKVRTKKDLLVRLQGPRFFVERDQVTLSANVHNYLPKAVRVKVKLDLTGESAEVSSTAPPMESWVEVPKDGEKRVDWTLKVNREGSVRARVAAQSQSAADATELTFPVLVHGVERQVAQSGVMRTERDAQLAIRLPSERKPGSSELVVQLNPSLGAVMLDALPYLVDYPYGCIEQTLSRFTPAVVVAKTLKDAGYDLEALRRRAEQLEEKTREGDKARPGGKTVQNSAYSYPKGRPGTIRIKELPRFHRWSGPVWDTAQMNAILAEGLARVRNFQREDGGWGWWPGDSSDPYMTAYALYALLTAREAGYLPDDGFGGANGAMLQRGLQFLRGRFAEDDSLHRLAYVARVLAMDPASRPIVRPLAAGRLWERRERLSAYSKALLATALHLVDEKEKARVLMQNIETTAKIDEENGTASWQDIDRLWWCWYNNKVETNAAVLQAYMLIEPEAKLPQMMVKWLVNNRRNNSWYSTRETAMAVYALADYVRVNKELSPEYTLTVDLGGKVKRSYTVTRENALFFDNQFIVPDELLESGAQTLSLTKDGPGALYYAAYTQYFSLEEPIRATSNEISVRRRYFKLLPGTASGQPEYRPLDENRPNPFLTGRYELLTDGGEWTGYQDVNDGPRYERVELKPGQVVDSGDLLEVELFIESKNDYEYLVFEDLKPAGCEPVEVRSGGRHEGGLWSNMELRDQKVAFFITHLPQGTRTVTYRLRAEVPGSFHVLPTNGYAMYAPDIRALSDETTIGVRDVP